VGERAGVGRLGAFAVALGVGLGLGVQAAPAWAGPADGPAAAGPDGAPAAESDPGGPDPRARLARRGGSERLAPRLRARFAAEPTVPAEPDPDELGPDEFSPDELDPDGPPADPEHEPAAVPAALTPVAEPGDPGPREPDEPPVETPVGIGIVKPGPGEGRKDDEAERDDGPPIIGPADIVTTEVGFNIPVTPVRAATIAPDLGPSPFPVVRTLVVTVLRALGYDPLHPPAAPNPVLVFAWGLYRRVEEFFVRAPRGPEYAATLVLETEGYPVGTVVGADGTIYQTTEYWRGAPITRVTVARPDGTVRIYTVAGSARGPVLIAPDGTVYQSTAGNGWTTTNVLVLTADGRAVRHEFVGADAPVDALPVLGPDGALYQSVSYVRHDAGTYTAVVRVTADGVTELGAVAGAPGALTVTAGVAYQTATVHSVEERTTRTNLLVLHTGSGRTAVHTLPGRVAGPVAVAADGTAYFAGYTETPLPGETRGYTYESTLYRLDAAGLAEVLTANGQAMGRVVIGTDGVVYLAVHDDPDATGDGMLMLLSHRPDAGPGDKPPRYAVEGVPADKASAGPIITADGTVYLVTKQFGTGTSRVLAVTPGGQVFHHELPGLVGTAPLLGPAGTLSVSVSEPLGAGGYRTTVYRIDAAEVVPVARFAGEAHGGAPVFGPEGILFVPLAAWATGSAPLGQIAPGGATSRVVVPAAQPGALTLGPGATVYWTVVADDGSGGFRASVYRLQRPAV